MAGMTTYDRDDGYCVDCGAALQRLRSDLVRCPWATSRSERSEPVAGTFGTVRALYCDRPRANAETARYDWRYSVGGQYGQRG